MAYVINEPCIGTRTIPASRSARWIDCDACVEACPVDAITPEDMVPPNWQHYIELNAAYYRGGQP